MPIYGRSRHTSSDGLHELTEVSFDIPPDKLRRIARFLNTFADEVEAGSVRTSHVHLIEVDQDWSDCDVILFPPSPDRARRVE